MKRVIKILILFSIFLFIPKLYASTGYISVTSSRSSVVVGNTFNVTVTISSEANIGVWEYTISYDTSKLALVSGDEAIKDWYTYNGQKSKSYNYTFKAKSSGTSTVSVKSYAVADKDTEAYMDVSVGSATISAITQAQLEASYSSNNNLSNITINNGSLTPEFSKDVTEYTVSMPSNTEKVTLSGNVEDYTASATGFGDFDVSEGDNKFEIKVTAQNGNTKVYTVNVKVEDKNPIEVNVNNKTFTVVKRESSLTAPFTFSPVKVQIGEIEVPGFYSDITKYYLVGLKSSEGKISLYIYDKEKNSYKEYIEMSTSSLKLYIKDASELEGFTLKEIEINKHKIKANVNNNFDNFVLIYAVNIETNEEGYYQYDKDNNTMIKYDSSIIEHINSLNKRNENYLLIIVVLASETIVVLMVLLISFVKNKRRRKRAVKNYLQKKEEHEKRKLEKNKVNNEELNKEKSEDTTKK